MQGVTILNTVYTQSSAALTLLIISTVGLTICGVLFFVNLMNGPKLRSFTTGFLSFIFFMGFLVMFAVGCILNQQRDISYEVTVDDSVSLTEFYEHYEVINKRGDIWAVKEIKKNETSEKQ